MHDTQALINSSSKAYLHWRMNVDVGFIQSDSDYELLDLGQSSGCSLAPRLSCTAVQAILTRSGQDDIGVYVCTYICGLSTHARRYMVYRHRRGMYAYRMARRSPPALRMVCPRILWRFYARCCLRRQRNIRVYCAQVNSDLRSFGFLSNFFCNIQPFDIFLCSSFTNYFRFRSRFRLWLFNQFRSRMDADFSLFTVV